VLGGADALAQALEQGVRHAIVAIGECEARLARARVLKTHGLTLVSARHPGAIVASSALVDPGTVIAAGAVVGVRTRLGESVIVNTRASIDHDCVLDEGVHVCPGACLAGHVRVGAGAWIGVGATIADDLAIGARSVIGAGAVVIGPIEAGVVAYGVPARAVRRVST
jgi:acetyltransferase EpsM